MQAEEVVALYTLLQQRGVRLWIDGGWGIDALLNRQTRPHKDLDLLVHFDDLAAMTGVLAERGFTLKEIWEESRWVSDARCVPLVGRVQQRRPEVATAFVLRNDGGHELDIHVLRINDNGDGVPAWESCLSFPQHALDGHGVITGKSVRCLSAQMQMATHTGYPLQDKDLQDLRLLHECFGIKYPDEHVHRSLLHKS